MIAAVKKINNPKPNGSKRPLGIPTMKDRVVQTLYVFVLDPIAEETSDSKSVHDNATYLKLMLGSYTATWRFIFKADIWAFFSSVSYKWLLKEFLKVGFFEDIDFNEATKDFLQGSSVFLVGANLVLNELQDAIGKEFF